MGIRLTNNAIKAGFLIQTPSVLVFNCTDVKEKAAADGKSKNYFYIWECVSDGEMLGVTVPYMANEKADWLHYPIFKALNQGQDLPEGYDMEPKSVKGTTLRAYCKRGSKHDDGSPINVLTDFYPLEQA